VAPLIDLTAWLLPPARRPLLHHLGPESRPTPFHPV